jgi:hypothetical protein
MKKKNNTVKRYVVSSIISFLTGFLTVLSIQITDLSVDTLTSGVILGIMFASLRGGIKALSEFLPTLK